MLIVANKITDILFKKPLFLYAFFLALIIALKWSFLTQQPVWDEAFSIFPAADFLVRNGFDYSLLLTQPSYHEGGPTAHALSLLTLTTAIVLKLTGGGKPAWIILHMMQWMMAAGIGTILSNIYSGLFEKKQALLLAVATICYPLILAQLGGMYIEVPLLFFSLWAFYHYCHNRIWACSASLAAACLIKPSGIIAVVAIVLMALFENKRPIVGKCKKAGIILLPSVVAVFTTLNLIDYTGHVVSVLSYEAGLKKILDAVIYDNIAIYRGYISHIPELLILLAESVFVAFFFLLKHFHNVFKGQAKESDVVVFNSLLILGFCLFHFVLFAVLQTNDTHFLSRYFFYIIPSMFLMIFYPIDRAVKKKGIKICLLVVIILICLINRDGRLYPPIPYSSIAMAERSEEYRNGYFIQKDYIAMIENKIPPDTPVYVSLPDYFLTHYPVSGYVTKSLTNVRFIVHILRNADTSFKYPDHFILVYSYPWLGGEIIQSIMEDVSRSRQYSRTILGYFKKGSFSAYVIEIKKKTVSGGDH